MLDPYDQILRRQARLLEDPYERLLRNTYRSAGLGMGGGRESAIPKLAPEEENSLLSEIGSGTLSAISYFGQTLDKLFGGRAVRGAIGHLAAGDPGKAAREALSVVPMSDMLGITNPQDTIYGDDLLRNLGISRNAGLASTIGVEMLLDPATYLTGGLSYFGKVPTAAGRVADAAGLLQKTLRPRLAAPTLDRATDAITGTGKLAKGPRELGMTTTLRQALDATGDESADWLAKVTQAAEGAGENLDELLDTSLTAGGGIGLPFRKPSTTGDFATGPLNYLLGMDRSLAFDPLRAARRLDRIGDFTANNYLSRAAVAAVSPKVRGMATRAGQAFARDADADIERMAGAAGTQIADAAMQVGKDPRIAATGLSLDDVQDVMNMAAEHTWHGARGKVAERFQGVAPSERFRIAAVEELKSRNLPPQAITDAVEALAGPLEPLLQRSDDLVARERAIGFNQSYLAADYSDYGAQRQRLTPDGRLMGRAGTIGNRPVPDKIGAALSRKDWTDIPGGTVGVNEKIIKWGAPAKAALVDAPVHNLAKEAQVEAMHNLDPDFFDWYVRTDADTWLTDWQAEQILKEMQQGKPWDAIAKTPTGRKLPRDFIDDAAQDIMLWEPDDLTLYNTIRKTHPAQRAAKFSEAQLDLYKQMQDEWQRTEVFLRGAAAVDPAYHQGQKMFSNDFMRGMITRMTAGEERIGLGRGIQGALAEQSIRAPRGLGAAPAGTVPLQDALNTLGMTEKTALQRMAERLHAAGRMSDGQYQAMRDAQGAFLPEALIDLGRNTFVPAELVEDAVRAADKGSSPRYLEKALRVFDGVTNVFKGNATVMWPAFHARNWLSAIINNFEADTFDPTAGALEKFIAPYKHAWAIVSGKTLPEKVTARLAKLWRMPGATPEEITQLVRAKIAGFEVAPRWGTMGTDLVGDTGVVSRSLIDEIPGAQPRSANPLALAKAGLSVPPGTPVSLLDRINPMATRGGTARSLEAGKSLYAPVAIGEEVADYSEQILRIAPFIAHLMQGKADDVAAAISKGSNVDYSKVTRFERGVLKRIFPFWMWTSRQLPWKLAMLQKKPGGVTRQAIRATDAFARRNEFTPPHIAQNTALALGQTPGKPEYSRFLTMDLPHESVFNTMVPGHDLGSTLQKTGSKILSQSHPLLKLIGEGITGQSFFQQGRETADLDPVLGRLTANVSGAEQVPFKTPWIDQAVMASPFSRYVTTAKQLTDSRRGAGATAVNLLTGLRVSDVPLDKHREAAARELAEAKLQDSPYFREFSHPYVSAADYPYLSDEEKMLARLLSTQASRKQQEARQRRKLQEQKARGMAAGY